MPLVKRAYVGFMQTFGGMNPVAKLSRQTHERDPYGWRRWAASLLAIYDAKRMVALGLPWWNVEATREIEQFLKLRRDARVFEYGAGASTVWLAQRAAEVISVEHDIAFIDDFREMVADCTNVNIMERSIADGPDAYVESIAEAGGQFDLIVIDGRYRSACLETAMNYRKPGGIILFDDSGRRHYRAAIEKCGLIERHYFGRSFCVPYPDHTSLLSRRD